ncbi:hypothetical protein [Streptomyces brasiliensis]|nr:hypothetical protein [Streptomyces brasiliensis]
MGTMVVQRLAAKASAERMALELATTRHFDPSLEQIFRRGIQLARASTAMPWRAPRRESVADDRVEVCSRRRSDAKTRLLCQ